MLSFYLPVNECCNCRSAVYDSSLGICLHSLHSNCLDVVVWSTAADIVRVFPEAMLKTSSSELKVNYTAISIFVVNGCTVIMCPIIFYFILFMISCSILFLIALSGLPTFELNFINLNFSIGCLFRLACAVCIFEL